MTPTEGGLLTGRSEFDDLPTDRPFFATDADDKEDEEKDRGALIDKYLLKKRPIIKVSSVDAKLSN